jgi:hypothetical protein
VWGQGKRIWRGDCAKSAAPEHGNGPLDEDPLCSLDLPRCSTACCGVVYFLGSQLLTSDRLAGDKLRWGERSTGRMLLTDALSDHKYFPNSQNR